ncbi:MAG: site-2 protease family protein [Bryobacteraceae bacterium]
MAATTSSQLLSCANCGAVLAPDALVCPNCRKFTHSNELNELASRARHATAVGQLAPARDLWLAALKLLPPESSEHRAVQRELEKLDARLSPKPGRDWKKRLGPFGVGIAALLKYKSALFLLLAKGKFFISILLFLGLYWARFGWWFAFGITASVLLHEMGHYVMVRRFGFSAELPMFLPGFGAFVKWNGANVDGSVRAQISLAGPLFGFFSGLLFYGVFLSTGQLVWLALAQLAGWINLLNLIPVFIFDGAAAMSALGAQARLAIVFVSITMFFTLHETLFLFIAIATGYRLVKRDFPQEAKQGIAYYFVFLILANGFLSWFATNEATLRFGNQLSVQ